jgi:phosphinothricin acetyltransferase
VHIRLVTEQDAPEIAATYETIVRDTAISFELEPPGAVEISRRITALLEGGRPWLVCASDSAPLGYAYAGRYRERAAYRWSVESSIVVAAEARGRGIGRALYTSLLAVLSLQGFRRVYAAIAIPNDASVALHRAVGFERAGTLREAGYKFGRWHDVEWWQRLLDAPAGSPQAPEPPMSLEDAQRHADWGEALDCGLKFLR